MYACSLNIHKLDVHVLYCRRVACSGMRLTVFLDNPQVPSSIESPVDHQCFILTYCPAIEPVTSCLREAHLLSNCREAYVVL